RYGDVGLLVETASSAEALALCAWVAASAPGVRARPGLRSVLVERDADGAGPAEVSGLARELATASVGDIGADGGRVVEIAVRYDGEDLPSVARRLGLEVAEVVARHAAPTYTVACLGFSRGFPYLEGLDPLLRLPRRDTPRARVPAGSVAIAAEQAGIYPQASPGGWHLLGRTDAVLFDPDREPPALLAPGDRVRFVPRGTAS
ncbi:MAG TPA: allophanate hydrolase subunit 1, partial [Kineosporiaceae bacterium]|nr:allophanate hydrolase subunit 1 [Kineosporiaceae bacterium]